MHRYFEKGDLWLGGIGLALGLVSALLRQYKVLTQHSLWSWPVLGALIGLLIWPAYRWLISGARGLRVKSAKVTIPIIGQLEVEITDVHRAVGWNVFVEASTRIATQRLGPDEGLIREALSSLHGLFEVVRTELKRMWTSPPPRKDGVYTVESYALRMLNDGLRPMLARWHPRLQHWEQSGRPESAWPLAVLCRKDLAVTRMKVLAYVWGLGEMLAVYDLEQLLGPKPTQTAHELQQNWTSDEVLAREMVKIDQALSETETSVGWHIYVELVSRIATQPLSDQTGDIREALTSLYRLFDIIRTELKRLSPTARSSAQMDEGKTVAGIALAILNERLRPFLAKWHPALSKWERRENKAEDVWSDEQTCRKELEEIRLAIAADTAQLRKLIESV